MRLASLQRSLRDLPMTVAVRSRGACASGLQRRLRCSGWRMTLWEPQLAWRRRRKGGDAPGPETKAAYHAFASFSPSLGTHLEQLTVGR
eukprot:gene4255-biopygen2388